MKSSSVGRADLLDAYRAGGPELQSALARLLGLEVVVRKPSVPAPENRRRRPRLFPNLHRRR